MTTKNTLRARLVRPVEHRHLRWLRKKMAWSLNDFAQAFRFKSRDYAKKLLRPRKPFGISKPVAARYRELRATVDGAGKTRAPLRTITIIANWVVEDKAEVLGMLKPKRCRGHRLLFIPNVPRRVYCTRGTIGECAKLWRLRHKTKKKKEKRGVHATTGNRRIRARTGKHLHSNLHPARDQSRHQKSKSPARRRAIPRTRGELK